MRRYAFGAMQYRDLLQRAFAKRKQRQAISPVIASIILIAVTIAVAIAVAGFVFGLFGTFTSSGGVTVIGPTSYTVTGTAFSTTLRNDASSTISAIMVSTVINGASVQHDIVDVPVNGGGGTGAVAATLPTPVVGTAYEVVVQMSDGRSLSVVVVTSA